MHWITPAVSYTHLDVYKRQGQNTTKPADTTAKDDGSAVKEVSLDDGANASDAGNPLKDPNNILSKRNVYFDFDSDAVKAEYLSLIHI